MEPLKQRVRDREQQCVDALLELFRFRLDDYETETLPIKDGTVGNRSVQSGVAQAVRHPRQQRRGRRGGGRTGHRRDDRRASLGAAAAIGATIGALWDSVRDPRPAAGRCLSRFHRTAGAR